MDNGLYIPDLCAIREAQPSFASCRLCFVEFEDRDAPVTACTEPVSYNKVRDFPPQGLGLGEGVNTSHILGRLGLQTLFISS